MNNLSWNNSLIGSLIVAIKDHSRAFGIAGAIVGAALVIYYCGSINFYPSGLTIADVLFFLWTVIVFGFYYSIVVFSFFIASLFWLTLLAKPINFAMKFKKSKLDIVVPLPKRDLWLVFAVGLIANFFILGIGYANGHSLFAIFGSLLLMGFLYTLIDHITKKQLGENELVDSQGNPIYVKPMNPDVVKYIFVAIIYLVPLLFAQIGGSVTRTTFETMGVRQIDVDLTIDAKGYKAVMLRYKKSGAISNVICFDVCILENVTILFTSIGSSTKINVAGINGRSNLVIPTKAIKLIFKSTSVEPTKDKPAATASIVNPVNK